MFFLVTNFGVWWLGNTYPATLSGLGTCYIAAIPFFGRSLLSTSVYIGCCSACLRCGWRVWNRRYAVNLSRWWHRECCLAPPGRW